MLRCRYWPGPEPALRGRRGALGPTAGPRGPTRSSRRATIVRAGCGGRTQGTRSFVLQRQPPHPTSGHQDFRPLPAPPAGGSAHRPRRRRVQPTARRAGPPPRGAAGLRPALRGRGKRSSETTPLSFSGASWNLEPKKSRKRFCNLINLNLIQALSLGDRGQNFKPLFPPLRNRDQDGPAYLPRS